MTCEKIKECTILLCLQIFRDSGVDTDILEYVDFTADLGMDSITFITLIVEIEAAFDITIPDDMLVMDNFKNVEGVVRVVAEQLLVPVYERDGAGDDET